MFQQSSVSHLQLCVTCTGGSFTTESQWLRLNLRLFSCLLRLNVVCACVRASGVFLLPPKLKFGVDSCVIGGLERATEAPPRCLSCHVGGVDLVILWESKVPLTAAWGVIHRAAHEEGRGASHIVCNATYEPGRRPRAMWKRVTVTLWPSVNCLYTYKDNFARGQSVFKRTILSVTTSQTIIIPTNSTVIILLVSTTTWLIRCD